MRRHGYGGCTGWGLCRTVAACCLLLAMILQTLPVTAQAPVPPELAARLSEPQIQRYRAYRDARRALDRALDVYWADVDEKRDGRRRKRAAGQPFTSADYAAEQPPEYKGPPLPKDIERIIVQVWPPKPEPPRAGLADFLAAAKSEYGYVPAKLSEREFKRRYAIEAMKVGLDKAQVVDVYALETGGRGTYDMQAGIDPETRQGKPISSALGYAQLLSGNSVNEIVKHGKAIIGRLGEQAKAPGVSRERALYLERKIATLQRMIRATRSLPFVWSAHVAFGNTPKGLGIHALNLDPDIGPWLQVIKLKGVLEVARKAGRARLSGPELEIMNLAGPSTGLEMMEPIGRTMPTTNFFARAAYYRNTIVRGKSGAELLRALDERMRINEKRPGAVEFARVFDSLRPARRPPAVAEPGAARP